MKGRDWLMARGLPVVEGDTINEMEMPDMAKPSAKRPNYFTGKTPGETRPTQYPIFRLGERTRFVYEFGPGGEKQFEVYLELYSGKPVLTIRSIEGQMSITPHVANQIHVEQATD